MPPHMQKCKLYRVMPQRDRGKPQHIPSQRFHGYSHPPTLFTLHYLSRDKTKLRTRTQQLDNCSTKVPSPAACPAYGRTCSQNSNRQTCRDVYTPKSMHMSSFMILATLLNYFCHFLHHARQTHTSCNDQISLLLRVAADAAFAITWLCHTWPLIIIRSTWQAVWICRVHLSLITSANLDAHVTLPQLRVQTSR